MKYAYIESGKVADIARVDPFSIFSPAYASQFIEAPDDVEAGWLYEDGAFTPAPPTVQEVPASCSRRQGQLALLARERLDDVEAAIAAITDPIERRAAQIEYEADTWERGNQFVQQMWAQLGGTDEELDGLFRLAVTF